MSEDNDLDKPNWIQVLEKEIDELREQIESIEDKMIGVETFIKQAQEQHIKTMSIVAILSTLVQASPQKVRSLVTEYFEMLNLARNRGISYQELIDEMTKNKTLPPSYQNIQSLIQALLEI